MANKLRLVSIEATLDGSGMVAHDIFAVTFDGNVIPGKHQTVLISEADIDVWAAMPDGTPTQKQAKNKAYKQLLAAALPDGWLDDDLQDVVDNNTEADVAAAAVDEYISVTLGQEYPLDFTL
jgi:hypothetical protein